MCTEHIAGITETTHYFITKFKKKYKEPNIIKKAYFLREIR